MLSFIGKMALSGRTDATEGHNDDRARGARGRGTAHWRPHGERARARPAIAHGGQDGGGRSFPFVRSAEWNGFVCDVNGHRTGGELKPQKNITHLEEYERVGTPDGSNRSQPLGPMRRSPGGRGSPEAGQPPGHPGGPHVPQTDDARGVGGCEVRPRGVPPHEVNGPGPRPWL